MAGFRMGLSIYFFKWIWIMRVSRAVSFTLGKRGRVIWKRSLLSWTKKAGVDIFYFSNPTWIQNKKTVSFLNTMIFQNFVLMGLTYCNACWPIWRGFCQQKNAYVGFKSLCSVSRLTALKLGQNKKRRLKIFRRRFYYWIKAYSAAGFTVLRTSPLFYLCLNTARSIMSNRTSKAAYISC